MLDHDAADVPFVDQLFQLLDHAFAFRLEARGAVLMQPETIALIRQGGIKKGDLIVGLNGKPVKDLAAYAVIMGAQKKGNTVEVEVVRKGKKMTLKVKLE